MLSIGFKRFDFNCCLYSKVQAEIEIYFILYVEDLLISGSGLQEIQNIKLLLSNKFKMKGLGELQQYLGLEIEYIRHDH